MPFVMVFTQELIEGKEREALYYPYKELRHVAGTKKTGDSHTAKALWTMKAAKDRRR